MGVTKILLNENVDTKILKLNFNEIKEKKIDDQFRLKLRKTFHYPGIIILDNILDEELLNKLQLSLSSKKRKFKDKFIDQTKISEQVKFSKLIASEIISEITTNLFGFNTPKKDFGLRNMICNEEPMHFDSFFSKCGITPLMSITNIDKNPRLWNVSSSFDDLLIRKNKEFRKLFIKDNRNISASIKIRENCDLNFEKDEFHKIYFAPNSMWFTNPKIVSHQLVSGGGILINTWNINELPCKCQDCLLRKNGFNQAADQALQANKNNILKKIFRKIKTYIK